MATKVTLQNLKNFIDGYSKYTSSVIGLLPDHIREQIAYRMYQCKDDCLKEGKCMHCGCKTPQRLYTTESCNKDRFPDMMNRQDWEQFKIDNEIQ